MVRPRVANNGAVMYYDPAFRPQGEPTKTAPDLAGFIVWLETQPKETEYNFYDPTKCAVCRYLQSTGETEPWIDTWGSRYHLIFGTYSNYLYVAETRPQTYGAALARAKEAQ